MLYRPALSRSPVPRSGLVLDRPVSREVRMSLLKSIARSTPPIKKLIAERDRLRAEHELLRVERDRIQAELDHVQAEQDQSGGCGCVPPGHFHSPIPAMEDVLRYEGRIFDRSLREIPGVDLNVAGQLELLGQLAAYYAEVPFPREPTEGMRYYFENDYFSYADAIFLYGMIRQTQPTRIIEIGSGFSSSVMLDTNERFFGNRIRLTFIEPVPDRLLSRLKEDDAANTEILARPVQDVELALFQTLEAGDILFVDSSHVVKAGSDVSYILFDIIPRLRPGVLVHFHDMFYPFEYPRAWVVERRMFWNEDYVVRAFLQFNTAFQVVIWNQFLGTHHAHELERTLPMCLENIGGSLWLRRRDG